MIDPVTASLISAGSNVLGSALKQAPKVMESSASAGQASDVRQTFDFGGWTVATGGSKADGATEGLALPPLLILGAVFLAVWAWRKRK